MLAKKPTWVKKRYRLCFDVRCWSVFARPHANENSEESRERFNVHRNGNRIEIL